MERCSIIVPPSPDSSFETLTPAGAVPRLSDFFDLQEIQKMQDAFAVATGMAMVITDTVGKPITKPSNFCRLCQMIRGTEAGADNCRHSDAVLGELNPNGPILRPCLSGGLWDAGTSLIVDGQHVGNWLMGQVLVDARQEERVMRYADDIGIDPEQFRLALAEVTRMPLEQYKNICQLLFLIVQQLSKLATENIQKEREIRRRQDAERLQAALYQISETVSSSNSLEELYRSVHAIISTLLPTKNFYIALLDEEQGMLHFPYRVDECDGNQGSRKVTNGLAEYAIRMGKPLLIDPARRQELEKLGEVTTIGTRAMDWLGVPLKTTENKVFGVMAVFSFIERVRYTQQDQAVLSFVSDQVAMAIERKQAEETLHYLSMNDSLTGLYNRSYFEKKLGHFGRDYYLPLTVLICDIDGLKLVNDTFGHAVGDNLLKATATLIGRGIRPGDFVARIGGDEFAIIIPNADDRAARVIAARIRALIADYKQASYGIPLSLSLGYAVRKNSAELMQDVVKNADNAMYREKLHHSQSGRSAIVQTVMKLLEERDFMTEEHATRLQELVVKVAQVLQLPEASIADLELLAKFHDIGKIGIPDRILLKEGILTLEERQEMQRHCEIGYRIAQAAVDLVPIAHWILKHQEWWNGNGYPLQLAGEKIPLECRIVAIADAYDAMTNDRPYRKALSHEAAIAELRRFAGVQFDPNLVEKFISII